MFLIKNIYLSKQNFTLDIPTLEIPDDGLTLVLGPSGSGKSLFLKTLMGIECSDKKFQWTFKGVDLAALSPPDRRLGVVFQSLELFPHLSAADNILFHAKARGIEYSRTKLMESAELAGLVNCIDQKVDTLSGGEKQRVAILRAFAGNPKVLLMDEPFSSLDELNKKKLRVFLKELLSEQKIPCILVSHDMGDFKIADHVIYLEDGKISEAPVGDEIP